MQKKNMSQNRRLLIINHQHLVVLFFFNFGYVYTAYTLCICEHEIC